MLLWPRQSLVNYRQRLSYHLSSHVRERRLALSLGRPP